MDFSNPRPGCPIYPPAIARHIVFRLSMDDNPRWMTGDKNDGQLGYKARGEQWKKLCLCLSNHVNDLRIASGNSGGIKIASPKPKPEIHRPRFSAQRSAIIPITPRKSGYGYRLRVRVDIHTELFSITYLFDRIDRDAKGPLPELMAKLPSEPGVAQSLLDDFWIAPTFAATEEIAEWLSEAPRGARKRDFGELVMDFRGIILRPREEWRVGSTGLARNEIRPEPRRQLEEVLAEFAEKHAPLIRAIAEPGGHGASHASGGEAVVCGMLNGKAIYAAQLGRRGKPGERVYPVQHLLVYAGRSAAQLGRLVRRMHVLGELRHAAVLDWEVAPGRRPDGSRIGGLRDVSREMRSLGRELNESTFEITKSEERTTLLQDVVRRMADISRMIEGGLTYRVEQSRYYAEEFERAVKHLRLIRMGDWQPYNDYVERYILHLFARIHRIGNRYEALGRRVDRLLFFKQAQRLDSYTQEVRDTLVHINSAVETLNLSVGLQTIATGQLRVSADEQMKASGIQIGLLEKAEAFAIVFLTYYLGYVIHNVIELCENHQLETIFAYAWLVAALVAVANLLRIIYSPKRETAAT